MPFPQSLIDRNAKIVRVATYGLCLFSTGIGGFSDTHVVDTDRYGHLAAALSFVGDENATRKGHSTEAPSTIDGVRVCDDTKERNEQTYVLAGI